MAILTSLLPPEPLKKGDLKLLILVGIAMVIGQYDFSMLTLALPDVQAGFSVAEEDIGSVVAWARLGAIPAIFFALWSDRFGRRAILLWTLLGFSAFTIATAFAPTIEFFIAFQFLARVFTAAEEAIAIVFVLEMARDRNRGWNVGVLSAMAALGAGLASTAYGFVEWIPFGWRGLYGLAAVPVLYVAWLRLQLPETRMFLAEVSHGPARSFSEPVQEILREHKLRFALLATVSALFWFQMSAAFNFMSKYLQEAHNYGKGSVAILFIGAGAFALIANIVAGAASDRIGRKLTVTLALLLNVTALLWFYNTSGSWLPVAWIAALLGFFAVDVVTQAINAEVFPTSCRSTASTGVRIFSVAAVAIGLILEGQFYTIYGSHPAALSHMIPVALLAIPVLWLGVPETAGNALE